MSIKYSHMGIADPTACFPSRQRRSNGISTTRAYSDTEAKGRYEPGYPGSQGVRHQLRVRAHQDQKHRTRQAGAEGEPSRPADIEEGLRIHPKTLERFPQLGPYLDMLNKAVVLDDCELMEYIGEKIASILQVSAAQKDRQAANR